MNKILMNEVFLKQLIARNEGIKLDFKRELKLSNDTPSGTEHSLWKKFIEGQWHEFIKDILSLANGNTGTSRDYGFLVIGVGDTLREDGTRELFDTSYLSIKKQQIISKINGFIEPPMVDLELDTLSVDGHVITVVTIPPSPFVYETTKPLHSSKGSFDSSGALKDTKFTTHSARTTFIRRGDEISPASRHEWEALKDEKKLTFGTISQDSKKKEISLKQAFFTELEDTGVQLIHPHAESVTLGDIFVFPDLRHLESSFRKMDTTINSRDLLDSKKYKCILIFGDEQSGKTALVKSFYKNFFERGKLPILLRGDELKSRGLEELLSSSLHHQYENLSFSDYLTKEKFQRCLIVDDFYRVKVSDRYIYDIIEKMKEIFDLIIFTSNMGLRYRENIYLNLKEFHEFSLVLTLTDFV